MDLEEEKRPGREIRQVQGVRRPLVYVVEREHARRVVLSYIEYDYGGSEAVGIWICACWVLNIGEGPLGGGLISMVGGVY